MERQRATRCKWIEWDDEGRPRCEHGWAYKGGDRFRCRMKHSRSARAYDQTPAGKEQKARWNHSLYGQSVKQMYEITRVRGVLND